MMFYLNKKYVLRKEKDAAGLMSDSSDGTIYVLNPVAMFIVNLLGSEPCEIEEIISKVGAVFKGGTQETLKSEIETFITDAESKGFLLRK